MTGMEYYLINFHEKKGWYLSKIVVYPVFFVLKWSLIYIPQWGVAIVLTGKWTNFFIYAIMVSGWVIKKLPNHLQKLIPVITVSLISVFDHSLFSIIARKIISIIVILILLVNVNIIC